jgi:superfamily II DNA or RNA helicase
LHAVRDWLASGRPALIVVPSTLLLEQWREEAGRELAVLRPHILLAGGGHDEWRSGALVRVHTEPGPDPRLVIATVQTASTDRFRRAVRGGDHLLVVADEVHRLGSSTFRNVLQIESGAQLGLSATPVRLGDAEGTSALSTYFGEVVPPIVSLRDAIKFGRLCPYQYYIHVVELAEEEADEYRRLTAKIGQALGASENRTNGSGYLDHLLIQRARVIKQARAKAAQAAELVLSAFNEGEHWLVYCDDQTQVGDVLRRLRVKRIDAFDYHSNMRGDRGATMDHFRRFGGVLVAIRCLDEGVDLPEVTHAVIVASSRNTREFIQRRGRVLRAAPGKRVARIHDLLVRPPDPPSDDVRNPFTSIAESEIARAAEFARDAENAATRTFLDRLCIEWEIPTQCLDEVEDEMDGEEGE